MDDLLDLFAEMLDAGDLDAGALEAGLETGGGGLGLDVDGLDMEGTADAMLDPLAEDDLLSALHDADLAQPEETFLGARITHGDPVGCDGYLTDPGGRNPRT